MVRRPERAAYDTYQIIPYKKLLCTAKPAKKKASNTTMHSIRTVYLVHTATAVVCQEGVVILDVSVTPVSRTNIKASLHKTTKLGPNRKPGTW